MSLRSKTCLALLTIAISAPLTSFARWIPDNTEQGGTEVYDWSHAKTRAQVLEELEQAKADPTWATRQGEETGVWPVLSPEPQKTREEVVMALKNMSAAEKAYIQSFYTGA